MITTINSKKAIIFGTHPIVEVIKEKCSDLEIDVVYQQEHFSESVDINVFHEIYLLSGTNEGQKSITQLNNLIEGYDIEKHGGRRLVGHLLLQDRDVLRMLQTCDMCETIKQKIDVYPFSIEEIWSRSIVLDYEPITIQSDKHVHLVIFGMGEVAETVAIQAAHIAHYPNYVRNHLLRTRITMINENAETLCKEFIKRYRHLFDNSYYRVVKPSEEQAVKVFHKPTYEGIREDFVDVEWEFVDAESWNPDVREKLKLWAQDDEQLLTVVMADRDENKNVALSLFLPDELYRRSIPIHKYNPHTVEYDVSMPLVQMAKNVNYIYARCYNDNIENWQGEILSTVEIDPEERDRLWDDLSSIKRQSSIYNAMTIPSKMRSLGLDENDWDKFYDIPQKDIEVMAQVEHNRWSVEELILGFRPCTDDEQETIAADVKKQKAKYKARKIHYDLRAYNDLKPDGTGKSVQVYDLCLTSCLPLIAKAFADEKGSKV